MMRDDIQLVKGFILSQGMVQSGHSVLVAVSGGADSMCLLDILCNLDMDIHIFAAHYNHGLRSEESDRDEGFVNEYCKSRSIQCFCKKGDVAAAAMATGRGIEETAREMRYAFLQESAGFCGADRIATAHNADDNVETVLMNIIRGAGLDGICGIPPVRDNIIRPLLCMTRGKIEDYLKHSGVPNTFDSSNIDQTFTRNRLRHRVVPVLRELNPDLSMSVMSMTQRLRADRECLSVWAREIFDGAISVGVDVRGEVSALLELPEAIRSRVIRLALDTIGVTGDSRIVRSIDELLCSENPSARISLRGGRSARREYGEIVFCHDAALTNGFQPINLDMDSETYIPELGIQIICGTGKVSNNSLNNFYFKNSDICGNIAVRPRYQGDKITLAGRKCTKTLKKLFIEAKIPEVDRSRIPVFTDDKGVIAVMGLGIAQRCVPSDGDEILSVTINDYTNQD